MVAAHTPSWQTTATDSSDLAVPLTDAPASRGVRPAYHVAGVLLFYTALFGAFFSPILCSDRLLAPGDGTAFFIPTFFGRRTLWEPMIFGGFPLAAEPQLETFYPLGWLLSRFGAWNAFVVSAYVMAAAFTYAYVYTLTRSVLGALVGGVVYSMSGFFMAHLGHTAIIHGAAWMPLLLWAAERLRRPHSRVWVAVASLAVANAALGAHPQMLVYSLGLTGAYVVVRGWSAPGGCRHYYRANLSALALGLGLAAIQLVPAAQLAHLSYRARLGFVDFVAYALPPIEFIQQLFPYLFGPKIPTLFGSAHFGRADVTETSGYVGIGPLMIAGVAIAAFRRHSITRFWATVALLACLIAFGASTPLARVMYVLPGYKLFRCPARHLVEMALAVATLAGLGVAALQQQGENAHRLSRRAACIGFAVVAGAAVVILAAGNVLRAAAAARGVPDLPLLPWKNPALGVPLVLAGLSAGVIVWYARAPRRRWRAATLLLLVVIDLGTFGWFQEWHYFSPERSVLQIPAMLQPYKTQVLSSATRVVSFEGPLALLHAAVPNLNRLWEIPNASGGAGLMLQRSAVALPPEDGATLRAENRVLDLLAARYLLLSTPRTEDRAGFTWGSRLNVVLDGSRRGFTDSTIPDVWVSHVGLVAALTHSVEVTDGTVVASLRVTTVDGRAISLPIRAGDELSEWSYDRPGVAPTIRHRRAALFESDPTADGSRSFQAHWYLAVLDLAGRFQARSIEIELTGNHTGGLVLQRLSLADRTTGRSYPLWPGMTDVYRWRHLEDREGVSVYENLHVMPRAWIVPTAVTLKPDDILGAIRYSTMPDGAPFDPAKVALVEEPAEIAPANRDLQAAVTGLNVANDRVDLRTRSNAAAFLVLSDLNYPGWQATVDGQRTHVYQTDYLLRGVTIPAGEHTVEFVFRPASFYLGLGITALSMFGLLALTVR